MPQMTMVQAIQDALRVALREDERVVVWLASFASQEAFERARASVDGGPRPFETFVLEPGRRSRLRHRGG